MGLSAAAVREGLRTRVVGKRVTCLGVVDSTNEEAWHEALAEAEEGSAIFADEQRKGRGRMGRLWHSPRGKGLLCSVILRPRLPVDKINVMTAIGALAVVDTLKTAARIDAVVKFPNDVLVGGRKIAGILVESRFIAGTADVFVLGVGLNVNVASNEFPPELRERATSLRVESGRDTGMVLAARRLLESLDRWYDAVTGGRFDEIAAAWRSASMIRGKRVRITEGEHLFTGTVDDVDPVEGIILRLGNGHVRRVRGEHVEHLELL
ncbi:MAG: biotin--[acetyl-CoA-carboxylase] ligase [Planctomycetes bacterium RBG_16_59_8]|nr:MAG: biotin--[acetyl-CoA-carboxylase] ligase [Planctomycetes bacterium RBG_16_59_8]